jgi:hypothetical protein
MTIGEIIGYCERRALRWTNHLMERLFQRSIGTDDVVHAMTHGEIIEQYLTDYPFPSCLLLGPALDGSPLHIVCGSNGDELWLVTTYRPRLDEWTGDFKTRKDRPSFKEKMP